MVKAQEGGRGSSAVGHQSGSSGHGGEEGGGAEVGGGGGEGGVEGLGIKYSEKEGIRG